MKTLNKILYSMALGMAVSATTTSCDDFDDININPASANEKVLKPYYALNSSIINAQQDPDVQERIFVYNWASAARIAGEMGFASTGSYNDSFNAGYMNSYINKWLEDATKAIQLAENSNGNMTEAEAGIYANIHEFARIWRAVLIAEFCDNFGPYPLDAFQGVTPNFNTVEEDYDFILKELKEATAAIQLDVEPTKDIALSDPAFGYNAAKWKKFGNTLRLRYAMRLSEVNRTKAQQEFEDAAKGELMTDLNDMFKVKEYDQWNAWSPVYSRPWLSIALSSTMSNIMVGLGNISVEEQRPDLNKYVKPANYLGIKLTDYYAENTDNPTKQHWMDGIPQYLDPRGLKIFCLPNDTKAANFVDKEYSKYTEKYTLIDDNGKVKAKINAEFTWNYYPNGESSDFSESFAKNKVVGSYNYGTLPLLGKQYRDATSARIWVAPWETAFLMAEAAVYGWKVNGNAKDWYEKGVKLSFAHFGLSQFADKYLASTDYNRVGTSVKFDHTTEPSATPMEYIDGYKGVKKQTNYKYPDANKILYKGHKLNDELTKIITQKYIAQTPYGALEMWNDYRRLGLPFFDMPANESAMTGTDMDQTWGPDSWKGEQKIVYYPQRLRYPSTLRNADPEGYDTAVKKLGGPDVMITPLWWAKH